MEKCLYKDKLQARSDESDGNQLHVQREPHRGMGKSGTFLYFLAKGEESNFVTPKF